MNPLRILLLTTTLTVTLALPGAASAAGTTYYVGPALNTTGSCDQAHECTIDYALSKATTSGDVVYVERGTYVHAAGVFNSGTMQTDNNAGVYVNNGVTLKGAPGLPRPTIVQNDPYIYSHPAGISCNCGVIGLLAGSAVSHVRIVQHDVAAGGPVTAQPGITIDDSELIGDGQGAQLGQGTVASTITGSLLVGSPAFSPSSPVTIKQSTLVSPDGGDGLNAYAAANTIVVNIHNSIVRSTTGADDISANGGTGSLTINVDHSATRVSSPAVSNPTHVHINDNGGNVESAPLFADAANGNYRQAVGSPTIDAGSAPVPSADLDGDPFSHGAGPDIGAYEYHATRNVTSGGSASSDCIAPNPACSLTHALAISTSGDHVVLASGAYALTTTTPFSVPTGVHVIGAAGLPRPTISRATGTGCSSNCSVLTVSSGASLAHVNVLEQDNTNNAAAVQLADHVSIDDSLIEGAQGGITPLGSSSGGHIRTSVVIAHDNTPLFSPAVWVQGNFTIAQSTIVNTGAGNALEVDGVSGQPNTATVSNSAFKSAGASTLRSDKASSTAMDIQIDYSVWNGNADNNLGGTVNGTGGVGPFNGPHDVVAVPTFADSEMRPAANSPQVDAAFGPVTGSDLDGRPFTNGLGPDIGAYEYYAPVVNPPASPPPAPPAVITKAILPGVNVSVGAKLKKGKLSAKVTCPKAAVGSCGGSLSVTQGKKKPKTTKVKAIKPGKTATLKIKAKQGKASITVTLTDGAGASGSKTVSKKLK